MHDLQQIERVGCLCRQRQLMSKGHAAASCRNEGEGLTRGPLQQAI